MKKTFNYIKGMLIAVSLFSSSAVLAATQGTLGTVNSQGTINISATIGNLIQISALNDVVFPAATLTASEAFCVYRNGLTGAYGVQLDSANGAAAGDYDLLVAGNRIGYTVTWNGVSITEGAAALADAAFVGNTTDTTCGAATNATVALSLIGTEYSAAPAGTYVDVLTMTVTPL
jgi:hypothetical protein